MSIDFSAAAATHALIGGAMIGIAAATMLLALGRIAGVSGLAARALNIAASSTPRAIAIAFIVGLPLGAALINSWHPVTTTFPAALAVVVGGLLVGFGTRLGSGCTSGHGVCGISRLSPRSIAATVVFIGVGFAVVAALRILGLS